MKRRPDHPDYDPGTLFVPTDFMNSQTPVSKILNMILYFKQGRALVF
jgi:hypothetical protein